MINEKKLDEEIVAFCKGKIDSGYYKMDTVDACVEIRHIIEEQPKVGEWTPCSERLPEAEGLDVPNSKRKQYLIQMENGRMLAALYLEINGVPHFESYAVCIKDKDVIAWMPLPEPYKVGDQE